MRGIRFVLFATPLPIALLLLVPRPPQEAQLSPENAYNPVPSPDGKKIAAVRTGWFRPDGISGSGRSSLLSDLIVMTRAGRVLSPQPLADRFVGDWSFEGIMSFRDRSYTLLAENGTVRQEGQVCQPDWSPNRFSQCTERVVYLPHLATFVWVYQKWGDSFLLTPQGDLSPHFRDGYLGENLAASPDERYIAVSFHGIAGSLYVYDLRQKCWSNLGPAAVTRDQFQDAMNPTGAPGSPAARSLPSSPVREIS